MTALLLVAVAAVGTFGYARLLGAFVDGPAWRRTNYRDRVVTLLGGTAAATVLVAGLGGAAAYAGPGARARLLGAAALAALVAGAAGLYDDLRGDTRTKGLAGHLRALARGELTSGAVKIVAIGTGGLLAGLVHAGVRPRALVEAAVVAGCANLLNLFDLRPGRALKVGLLTSLGVAAAAPAVAVPLVAWTAGVTVGALPDDLRERAMLGDAGANAVGSGLGVAVVAVARAPAALWATLAVVVALTLLSERVSFSRVIDRTPPLRWLDLLGRRP